MTALGRQETWEDSPEGYPQSQRRTNGGTGTTNTATRASRWFGDPDPTTPTTSGPSVMRVPVADPPCRPALSGNAGTHLALVTGPDDAAWSTAVRGLPRLVGP